MENTHIVTKFDDELNKIETMLMEMSKQVGTQIRNASLALAENDEALAKTVAKGDAAINKLENKIKHISTATDKMYGKIAVAWVLANFISMNCHIPEK